MKRLLILLCALAGLAGGARAQVTPEADWANFARFEQANRNLSQRPDAVFMGNSITEIWANKYPGFFTEHNYAGRGISGQTTSQMLVRFRADVVSLRPQIVVICGGTNDIARNNGIISLQHVLENIVSMVELARANGIRPVLCSLLPASDFSWRKGLDPAPKIIEFNAMLREYARREKIPFVDYHTPMAEPDGGMVAAYTYDGVHPTEAGYAVMEKTVQPVLEKMLNKRSRNRRR